MAGLVRRTTGLWRGDKTAGLSGGGGLILSVGAALIGATIAPLVVGTHVTPLNSNTSVKKFGSATENGLSKTAVGFTSGKYYWEVQCDTATNTGLGISNGSAAVGEWVGQTANSYGHNPNGNTFSASATVVVAAGAYTTGTRMRFAYDADNGRIWSSPVGSNWNGDVNANPATNTGGMAFAPGGTYYPTVGAYAVGDQVTMKMLPATWSGTAPTGFSALTQSPLTFDSATTALLARMGTPPNAQRQIDMDNTIRQLKNTGVWTLLDRLYIHAFPTQAEAMLNWTQNLYNGSVSGSVTFVADQGFTGDGVSGQVIHSGSLSSPLTNNNIAIGVWCRTNVLENKADAGGGSLEIRSRAGTGLITSRLCDASTNSAADVTTAIGLSVATIDPGNTANRVVYKNGVVETASSARATIVALPGTIQGICGTAAGTFSTKQIAASLWAQNLSAQNVADLYTAIAGHLTAMGAA